MIADFKKKQKTDAPKKIVIAIGGICIVSLAVFLIMANIGMYKKRQELNYQVKALQNKIEEIKTKNSKFKEGILQANNDQYIEKVAREELDMQKPGEKVISFIQPTALKVENGVGQKSIWQNFSGWLGGWFKK